MVTLADALSVLYPAAEPLRDYTLVDDGTGPRIVAWNLPAPQPTQAELDAVTEQQVVAVRVGKRRQEAGIAAATAADGTSVANRAAESVGASRDNDLAETMRALCGLLGITTAQLADRITADRATYPPPTGSPTPAEAVASATTRLDATAINQRVGLYIAVGAGDPMQ